MAAEALTRSLLNEEAAVRPSVAEALFTSVSRGVPMVLALLEARATPPDLLTRYLGRSEAPFLRQVVPALDLVERLPQGLCQRLFAIPVRHDAITGTVDVVVADTFDLHPAEEIGFQLGAPVRLVRASVGTIEEALRRMQLASRAPPPFEAPPPRGSMSPRVATPPWGTPVAAASAALASAAPPPPPRSASVWPGYPTPNQPPGPEGREASEPPRSGYGSEIPIPLTRKTYYPFSGGTQRPPALVDPRAAGLGEGYALDTEGLRDVVERRRSVPPGSLPAPPSLGGFIPKPPPLPRAGFDAAPEAAMRVDLSSVFAAIRSAESRDAVLELVLAGARAVASRVALFVVKKGGYLGWIGSPEFAEPGAIGSILVPLETSSIFDRAVREDVFLGPIPNDAVHAPLLRAMQSASRDVAAVPVRVSGKTAVVILADELADTMIGTRRLEELAHAAGDAFARIVRSRR